MNPSSAHIDDAVVAICEQGCREVNKVIARLISGHATKETLHLSHAERATVLQELQEVMAVYDTPCDQRQAEPSTDALSFEFPQTEALVLG